MRIWSCQWKTAGQASGEIEETDKIKTRRERERERRGRGRERKRAESERTRVRREKGRQTNIERIYEKKSEDKRKELKSEK